MSHPLRQSQLEDNMGTILITGAAGLIGSSLRTRLGAHQLRLTDIRELPTPTSANETFVQCALADVDSLTEMSNGVDLVVHLGGLLFSDSFEEYVEANILGTFHLLEAAAHARVPRILYASTNHIVGYTPTQGVGATKSMTVRPDGFYGASKAAAESLCALYADNYGMTIVSARILSFLERPASLRTLSTWLSPDDMARLVEAALVLDRPGHHLAWGVSDNTRRWADLAEGADIGFVPRDDAEQFAGPIVEAATAAQTSELLTVGGRPAPRTLTNETTTTRSKR
jgi:uronate dehydrogenase